MDTFSIRKFNMKMIKSDSAVLIIGRRRAGKSTLIRDLLYQHVDIPTGHIFVGDSKEVDTFTTILSPSCVHMGLDETELSGIVSRQQHNVKESKRQITETGCTSIDPRCFVVIDDCSCDRDTIRSNKDLKTLFFNGRFIKTLVVLTSQCVSAIPPNFRCNLDYIFVFSSLASEKKKIYDYFVGFMEYNAFSQMFDQITENHGCMVIDLTYNTPDPRPEDVIYWYKADIRPPFRLCSGDRESTTRSHET